MYRSHFRPALKELYLQDHRTTSTSGDNSIDSATALLQMSREAPKITWLKSSRGLSLLSLFLHSTLVGIHLILIVVWQRELENRLVFSLESQKIISFLITAIATTFATTYSALLVFVTQTLSMRRDLQMNQMLTTTHDIAAAWAGIGSAISHIWHQTAVLASLSGVISTFIYLASISVLHITTSSLFSLETFNATRSISVPTQSLPAFNLSSYNISSEADRSNAWANTLDHARGSLYFLPSAFGSTGTPGLHQGTLYDVLESYVGTGNATVNAFGFNVTCGYLTDSDVALQYIPDIGMWDAWLDNKTFPLGPLQTTQPGVISSITSNGINITILYSTIPILDSSGYEGVWVNITPPMSPSVPSVQLFRCSQSLVRQRALVDAKSGHILTVEPNITKTTSSWFPQIIDNLDDPSELLVTPGISYVDAWEGFYGIMPESLFPRDYNVTSKLTVADNYLIENLGLLPPDYKRPNRVMLHDVENALSVVVASMFWTLGHIPPIHTYNVSVDHHSDSYNGLSMVDQSAYGPVLLDGTATVQEIFVHTRLDLSIIAIASGLAVSVALLLVSLQFSHVRHNAGHERDVLIDGTGILHAIWMYRNHPELEALLEQVEFPTNENLRQAGKVKTRLVDGRLRKRTLSTGPLS
ncbi:hypothetical protein FB451DRAFT_1392373 [Mycena latifolia]|nr:hypothetical protein FB451DRAFT_1392373 [Mycena latifolia]